MDARAIAAKVLSAVLDRKLHLDQALSLNLEDINNVRDKALVQELCYGTMRWYFRLDAILARLLTNPLKPGDRDIKALLLCGLYQMMFLRTPDHAAVSATVEAAKKLDKVRAAKLINAVLRRFQRERQDIEKTLSESSITRYAHPAWFISRLKQQWPEYWQTVLEANNQYPPLHLRVNRLKAGRDDYLKKLQRAGIEASPARYAVSGIHIHKPLPVEELPGFPAGEVTVQDFGAQLVTTLLDAAPSQHVLDACAAPGGKTGHIIELWPEIDELIAVEADAARVSVLNSTKARLGFAATIIHADIMQPESWWDGTPFDRILLDAPCSASGVVRRHPDIKYLRVPGQIDKLVRTQQDMLEALWPLLKPGGKLVYITCSVFKEENDEQIKQFSGNHANVRIMSAAVDWGLPTPYGRQTLPGHDEADGFYCSILLKASSL